MDDSSTESSVKTRRVGHLRGDDPLSMSTSVFAGLALDRGPQPAAEPAADYEVDPIRRQLGVRRKIETKTKRGTPRPMGTAPKAHEGVSQVTGATRNIENTMSLVGLPAADTGPIAELIAAARDARRSAAERSQGQPEDPLEVQPQAAAEAPPAPRRRPRSGNRIAAVSAPQTRTPIVRSPYAGGPSEDAVRFASSPVLCDAAENVTRLLDCALDGPRGGPDAPLGQGTAPTVTPDQALPVVVSIAFAVAMVAGLFYALTI